MLFVRKNGHILARQNFGLLASDAFSGQILGVNPFDGDGRPTRVPIFRPGSARPTLPFPHPWNYDQPIRILETYFWEADREQGAARHNRYLDVPGFAPVLVTRDPGQGSFGRLRPTPATARVNLTVIRCHPRALRGRRKKIRSFLPMGLCGGGSGNSRLLRSEKRRFFSQSDSKSLQKPLSTPSGCGWTRFKNTWKEPVGTWCVYGSSRKSKR